jgi:membrane associated rhomboid family serine protease
MLEDRDYMRAPEYGSRLSLTMVLIIVNAIVFLFELLVSRYPQSLYVENHYFALSKEGLESGFVWQLLTFQFMHAGLLHLLFNCWAIYVFGRPLEEWLGWKKFLILFLCAGVIGGVCQVLVALLWPNLFGGPVVGASAGGFGLIAAYAVLFPTQELTLLLFFVLPIRLSAKTLLMLSAVLALVGIIFPMGNVANAAHLGGMLAGVAFIRWFVQGRGLQWFSFPHRVPPRKSEGGFSGGDSIQQEVDAILDKISVQGIHSLTAHEREVLEKARARMEKHY